MASARRNNLFNRVTKTCVIYVLVLFASHVNSFSLHVTPARIVSFVTYSTGSPTNSSTTTTTTTTRPTLPPLTPPSNTTTTATTTTSSTTTRNSSIDPRDQNLFRTGDEELEEEVRNEEEVFDVMDVQQEEDVRNDGDEGFEFTDQQEEEQVRNGDADRFEEEKEEEERGIEEEVLMEKGLDDNFEINTDDMDVPREKRETITACGCYAPAQCNNTGNTDGTGLIDFRIISGGTPTCSTGLDFCCPSNNSGQVTCGSRFTPSTSYSTISGQAHYGDYPWMVLMQNTTDGTYVGGGVLIDLNHVLTVAHRITKFPNGTGLRIRLGEWDMSATSEQYPYRDFNISYVWIHESFNPGTLQNDIALIKLSTSVSVNPPAGITPICMPTTSQNFENQSCWVSGWGANSLNGQIQNILRSTDVPIVPPATCEASLRSTRLGNAWSLDRSSFICAGGDPNKDACTGDGGSGLVCEVSTGRWVLAGLVAWGIGCASQGVPAAYVNVVNYLPWIQSRTAQ